MASNELEDVSATLQQLKAERDRLLQQEHDNAARIVELQNQVYGEDDQTKKADQLRALLTKKFNENSGEDRLMSYDEFCTAIGMKGGKSADDQLLSGKIFKSMKKEGDTHIDCKTFVETLVLLNTGDFMSRAGVAFHMFDTDKNDRVSEDEFLAFLKCSLLENRLKAKDDPDDTNLREVVHTIFKNPEVDSQGISLAQFSELMDESGLHDIQFTGLEVRSRRQRVVEAFHVPEPSEVHRFLVNNWKRIFFTVLVLTLSTWAFIYKWCEYNNGAKFELMGYTLPLAKGAADVMKVTCVFLMIFMCRGFITIWRGSWIGQYLIEFDDAILYHKSCAMLFFVAMWVHVFAHIINVERIISPDNYDEWRTAYPDDGTTQPSRFDMYTSLIAITGLILTVGFSIVYFFACEYPRQLKCIATSSFGKWANNFNVFWGTHHLVFPCFIAFILHPLPGLCWDPCEMSDTYHGDSWQWLLLPCAIYATERLRRFYKSQLEDLKPEVLYAHIKRGSDKPVLQLRLTKPDTWRHGAKQAHAGMYCFIKCEGISAYEWHPFTLTSAPHENFVEVHVRGLGDWTDELCRQFEEAENSQEEPPQTEFADGEKSWFVHKPKSFPKMALEGPYGAPAQGYDKFKVLLLVGAGIGVTPFISILKDIWHKFDKRRCNNAACGKINQKNFPLQKAYFNFISRDQASMSWFKETLVPIVVDDTEEIIECHQHLTSAKADEDLRSAAIKIAQRQSINMGRDDHKIRSRMSAGDYDGKDEGFAGKDIITGAEANIPVHFGRPNWDKIFAYIKKKHPLEEVGVFFCGPPVIGGQLATCSAKYTSENDTKFFYYEEHF